MNTMKSRRAYALFGLLATLFGMAVGHLVASVMRPDSSPVLAVGSAVIDNTPADIKEWAIKQFESDGFSIGPFDFAARNYDKVILVGSVLIGVLVLAAVAGILTKKRFEIGGGMLLALVLVAAVAAVTRSGAGFLDVVPSIFTAIAGVAGLWVLHRTATGQSLDPRAGITDHSGASGRSNLPSGMVDVSGGTTGPVPSGSDDDSVSHDTGVVSTGGPNARRRTVLITSGVLAGAAIVAGSAGRWIGNLRARAEDVTLPSPAAGETAPALPEGLEGRVDGITPLRISNADFYRVDTRLDVPVVDSDGWSLTVDGDVENELEISFDELLDMPMVERDITLTCVSNSVGGKYVGGARWLGVPLQDVLDRAGVGSQADQILSTDFDGMTISTPLDLATDGREALIAVGMNGEQLPREHGFPVRMVIPGLYGFISATKWLTKLTLTTYAEQEAYWTKKGWGTDTPIKPSTRIDTPRVLSTVTGDELVVGGVAWAQNDGGVTKVQVQVDGGAWMDAEIGADVNNVYWRQWFLVVKGLKSGNHRVAARCIDGSGGTQTAARAEPFPEGASGIHTVQFTVG
jgi:DMSO/TMAO reductase YedYZ molybdopterin-dependent catalytic subunit